MTDQTSSADLSSASAPTASGFSVDRMLALCMVLVLGAFAASLLNLLQVWMDSEEYGHGLIVPIIALYIYWLNREKLSGQTIQPSWLGLPLALAGSLLHLLGVMADVDVAAYYGLLISLAALPMAAGGWRLLSQAWYPLLLILFVIPLPYLLSTLLTARMQLISSDIGVSFIRLFGLPVMQDGNVLHMGSFSMLVEEACSGLRYMYPLVSIGLIVAYFYRGPVWQKVLIVLSTVPITIGMNSLRIAVTGLIIRYWGSQAAEGFLHSFEGWIVFMLAFALLMLEIWVLTRLFSNGQSFTQRLEIVTPQQLGPVQPTRSPVARLMLTTAVIVAAGVVAHLYSFLATDTIPERERFSQLPFVIDDREVFPDRLSSDVLSVLRPDDYFIGDYKRMARQSLGEAGAAEHTLLASAVPISLYLVYYEAQKEGSVLHSPRACLPGGGWEQRDGGTVALEALGGQGNANRVIISRDGRRMLVYYWIHQQGVNYADEFVARASLLWQSLTEGRTDGGLVRIIVPLPDETVPEAERKAGEDTAEEALRGFVKELIPSLPRFMPG
ncbi:VPLPA-CTERM-specific exosortase XrtD [Allohahella marinimesophila]|uniref:Methanolan biosynthesis EpsI domain-containing protein n=1 Tax=Allohahella marinimesophila TaxID=1054972 RepID=A0ABP7P930_9GAMM